MSSDAVLPVKLVLACALARECYNEMAVARDSTAYELWKEYRTRIRQGGKIGSGCVRLYDAFAAICQDLGIFGDAYFYWRGKFFTDVEEKVEWEEYNGECEKIYYDLLLGDGRIIACCWPNAGDFVDPDGFLYEVREVKCIRPSKEHPLDLRKRNGS